MFGVRQYNSLINNSKLPRLLQSLGYVLLSPFLHLTSRQHTLRGKQILQNVLNFHVIRRAKSFMIVESNRIFIVYDTHKLRNKNLLTKNKTDEKKRNEK